VPYRENKPGWVEQPTETIPVARGFAPGSGRPIDSRLRTVQEMPPDLGQSMPPRGPVGSDAQRGSYPPAPGGRRRRASRPRWFIPAVLAAVLGMLYLADLVSTQGEIPRGTVVSGVEIGGMSKTAAEQSLRRALEPRQDRPVAVLAGGLQTTLDPHAVGLRIDWAGTLAAAGGQPLNPFTRLASFFVTRDVNVVVQSDDVALTDALDGINTLIRKEPTEPGVRFEGTTPVAVEPAPGEALDLPESVEEVRRQWLTGAPASLPVKRTEPAATVSESVIQRTIADIAKPAVAADVRVVGDGREAVLSALTISQALSFAPDGRGGLKPVLDLPRIEDALRPQLASTEKPSKNATISLVGGQPVVTPSVDGHGVDYRTTLSGLIDVLKQSDSSEGRKITAVYADQPAKLTTEQVNSLGIRGVISEFSTGGFAADSGQNIRRAAEAINGKIVQPGELFSLNQATGPRDAAQGYVPAGIIEDNRPARGIGGGVSQLATTLYNAAYFAGMADVVHQEHSYYISRYPAAREATVFEGLIDLKFRNDSSTGVFIQTIWTATSITVRFWGTKRYEVTSAPGPRTHVVPPQTLTMPAGQPCTPSQGGEGFTTTDTRTLRDINTGQTTSSTRTVTYKPSPKIVCEGGPTLPVK